MTLFDRCLALVVATNGTASGAVAGVLHGLDSVELSCPEVTVPPGASHKRAGVRRRALLGETVQIGGIATASPLQTLVDLAADADTDTWEQMLESALRKDLVSLAVVESYLPELGRRRTPGTPTMRHVVATRPPGAPSTGSLLETLFVQLVRRHLEIAEPSRQVEILNEHGEFVARVDFAWPHLGLFIELDGQHHAGQPVHDARRETNVIAATGWLVARFTWDEVVRYPTSTARQLARLVDQARRRRFVDPSGC